MTSSTRTAFSWNAWTCSWETTVEVAAQPQETMWAALTALIPEPCQGVALTLGQDREVGCRIEVTPEGPDYTIRKFLYDKPAIRLSQLKPLNFRGEKRRFHRRRNLSLKK